MTQTDPRTQALMQREPSEVMAMVRTGQVSRRDLMKLFTAMGLTATGVGALGGRQALAAEELTMIVWEGYTDDKYRMPFEEANGVTVAATFAGTGDEMFAGMKGSDGKSFDMVSASSDLPERLFKEGLLQPIDTAKISNFDKLWDQFKKPNYITFEDTVYGVNFAWGPTIMIYDPAAITEAPTSWHALMDEQYDGKIATWNYPIQIAQYALLLDPAPEDPYNLTDEQLAQVKDILIAQRPRVRKYWDYGGEVAELFTSGEIVIADGWSWITNQIRAAGGALEEVIPTEGVTGWSDSWLISKNAANADLCHKWADWMISDEAQVGLTEVMGYAITNKDAAASLPADIQKALRLDNVEAEYAKIHMWKYFEGYDKWVQVWQEATQG